MRARLTAILLLVGVTAGGCYQYVPVRVESAANNDVRVRVTEPVAERLVKDFGAYTSELDGRLTPDGSDSVSISVTIAREYRGLALDSTTQVLHLSRAELVEVRRRALSKSRTALATAGALVVFGAFVASVVQWQDPNTASQEPPPPPPPSPIRILLSVPIR
jgi:hypothetical protein